jgi:hypothetical protein
MNVVRGTCSGATQNELLQAAQQLGATYFEVNPNQVRVDLMDERIDSVTYTRGGERVNVRYIAEFRAEVI